MLVIDTQWSFEWISERNKNWDRASTCHDANKTREKSHTCCKFLSFSCLRVYEAIFNSDKPRDFQLKHSLESSKLKRKYFRCNSIVKENRKSAVIDGGSENKNCIELHRVGNATN